MSGQPDAATLDALVLGTEDPEDRAAWKALVRTPGGAEAWAAAVARRRRMDLLAGAARGRPWLARALRSMTAAARRMDRVPDAVLSLDLTDASLRSMAGTTLGPAASEEAEPVQPAWGRVVPVRLRAGEHLVLHVGPTAAPLDVRYLCNGEEGALPSRTWKLEPGEAPVLILALAASSGTSPLVQALEQAAAYAGVLILADDQE